MSEEKTKKILELYAKMTLEQIFKLESNLPEDKKIMTKKIPVPKLIVNEEMMKRLKQEKS